MIKYLSLAIVSCAIVIGGAHYAAGGEVDVEKVNVVRASGGAYTFHVTLRHADTGWEHYTDDWEVLAPDGKVLGRRVLLHPHVNEQPFTRSLSGIRVPSGVAKVTIRADDKVHGHGGREMVVAIPQAGG